ncbi:MAG TPA: UDP-N-acetylmuramoyl-tripeptide--D-alanyl-D-alanine ligase [Planctomycetota bacterium]
MLGMTVGEVSRAVGGHFQGEGAQPIAGVTTDSRLVRPGDLFVALNGARTDGHRYLRQVHESGAAAAFVLADRGARPEGLATVVVRDPLRALGDLARWHLQRLRAPVVGITGTVGKTTGKEFVTTLLGGRNSNVHAAPASYNSECGLPLAVLGAGTDTRILVLEYGVNAPGEMDRLLQIAPPRHAWITALTEVHLEGMSDLATIVREKSQLARRVPESGCIWLPQSVEALVAGERAAWCGRVGSYTLDGGAGAAQILSNRPGAWRVRIPGIGDALLPVIARHEVELALGALGIAQELGVPGDVLRERLGLLQRPPGRLTRLDYGPLTVLDDSYNASPGAMLGALGVLAAWPGAGRRTAVLGTMHELGAAAERLHRQVGEQVAASEIDRLVAVGRGGAWIADAARTAAGRAGRALEVIPVADAPEAAEWLAGCVEAGGVVLLKASRAEGLDRLCAPLERAARHLAAASAAALEPLSVAAGAAAAFVSQDLGRARA